MITLAILNELVSDNVAGLEVDKNCFWEQAPLQANGNPASGVWLITRGGTVTNTPNGHNLRTTVDFYVALANKPQSENVHRQILEWILRHPCLCEAAGEAGGYAYHFKNIRIRPVTTPQNVMVTSNNLVVKTASAEIVYDLG